VTAHFSPFSLERSFRIRSAPEWSLENCRDSHVGNELFSVKRPADRNRFAVVCQLFGVILRQNAIVLSSAGNNPFAAMHINITCLR